MTISPKNRKTGSNGTDCQRLSGQTGRTVFESDTGPCRIRGTAWLYPRLSFLSGGYDHRPLREKDVERLKRQADIMLKNTGYEEISLSSLSTSDYRELEDLINYLIEHHGKEHVNISLPSLRVDAFSLDVMGKVQDIKRAV